MINGDFPGGPVFKNPPANAGDIRDTGSIPGLGRSSGGGNGNPLQYSCLENPMDRGAWWAMVHRIAKSWTQLKQLSTHTHPYPHSHTHICVYIYPPPHNSPDTTIFPRALQNSSDTKDRLLYCPTAPRVFWFLFCFSAFFISVF